MIVSSPLLLFQYLIWLLKKNGDLDSLRYLCTSILHNGAAPCTKVPLRLPLRCYDLVVVDIGINLPFTIRLGFWEQLAVCSCVRYLGCYVVWRVVPAHLSSHGSRVVKSKICLYCLLGLHQ